MNKENFTQIINALNNNQVVAYPTEAVFGLGCLPQSEVALQRLLALKQRDSNKGLILIAPEFKFFLPWININQLSMSEIQRLQAPTIQPTTWVVPVNTEISPLIRGVFSTVAIRICRHFPVIQLCQTLRSPIISTSANLSGMPPARTVKEVQVQFGLDFPILQGDVGEWHKPSQIVDLKSLSLIRE